LVLLKAVIKLPEFDMSAAWVVEIGTDPAVAPARVALGVPSSSTACPLTVDAVVRVASVDNGARTVKSKVAVADPLALVAVTVYAVAAATEVGVPVKAPVEVLKLMPAGVVLIAKLAIAPPVDEMVKPVATMFAVRVSDEDERVKAGAARVGAGAGAGASTAGGGGGGEKVVIAAEIVEGNDDPAKLLATRVNL
jgi:hypothetical protein